MIEENGHRWEGDGDHRCLRCAIKYQYYKDFMKAADARAAEGDPELAKRIRESMRCRP